MKYDNAYLAQSRYMVLIKLIKRIVKKGVILLLVILQKPCIENFLLHYCVVAFTCKLCMDNGHKAKRVRYMQEYYIFVYRSITSTLEFENLIHKKIKLKQEFSCHSKPPILYETFCPIQLFKSLCNIWCQQHNKISMQKLENCNWCCKNHTALTVKYVLNIFSLCSNFCSD